jgi:hypothetical protein
VGGQACKQEQRSTCTGQKPLVSGTVFLQVPSLLLPQGLVQLQAALNSAALF